jgi:hypothetical protein
MSEDTINIFVSHYHGDAKYIEELKTMIGKNGTDARDSSIYKEKEKNNAHNPDYIKSLIRPQIDWAGTVVVLVGPKTSDSDWVNWEIEFAAEHGKKIIGVFLENATDADLPDALINYGDTLVNWNAEQVEKAINGESMWLDPTGNPRTTPIEITRITC